MKNPHALILLVAASTAYGQIDNPPQSADITDATTTGRAVLTATNAATAATAIGLGATNDVTFSNVTASGTLAVTGNVGFRRLKMIAADAFDDGDDATLWLDTSGTNKAATMRLSGTGGGAEKYNAYLQAGSSGLQVSAASGFRVLSGPTAGVGSVLFAVNSSGNATLNGVNNTAPSQTADSASSLMTRSLSDVRYLGEMWNASKMAAYATTNPSVTVFLNEPMVTYTNLQPQGPFMQEFIPAEKYAGKTVKILAYCRVNSTSGGNVQGVGRISYLTNTAGGADSNFPLSVGGQAHGTVGVFTNAGTDVFPVATSTNQYLIFTSNVGTIPTNARMIVAAFGFNRASTNTTYTNNLYMHAVQLVVENP